MKHKTKLWSTMVLKNVNYNLAAGVINNGASAPVLSRPQVETVMGEMLSIGGSFVKSEEDLQEYAELKSAYASSGSNGDMTALINYYGEDLSKCRSIIQNEKAYLNWSLLSSACSIDITLANSGYAKSMSTSKYPLEAWNKDNNATDWSNIASLIIDDIVSAVEVGKSKQKVFKNMFVNPVTFGYIRKNTQVQNYCASRISQLTNSVAMPSADTINQLLNELCGIKIVVISDQIDRESVYGVISTAYAFASDVAVFTESDSVGHWAYTDIYINNPSLEVREGYFIVGNILEVNPSVATTYSKAMGFPVIDSYNSNFYLKTDANAWA